MKKKIFISYSDLDKSKMRSLKKIISNTAFFTPIVIADTRQALFQLSEKVKDGINDSDYVIPIITRKSITTQWINQEIGFATAKQKTLVPIVEQHLIDDLKGFIHKGLDLSYHYTSNEDNYKSEISKFARVAKVLINDLLNQNGIIAEQKKIEDMFPGKWRNTFDPEVTIVEGGKYLIKGKHWFNLTNVKIDEKRKKISFTKSGLLSRKDTRVMYNELKIVHPEREYVGFEKQGSNKYETAFYRIG